MTKTFILGTVERCTFVQHVAEPVNFLGRYCVECLHTEANVAHLYCTLANFGRLHRRFQIAVLEVALRSLKDVCCEGLCFGMLTILKQIRSKDFEIESSLLSPGLRQSRSLRPRVRRQPLSEIPAEIITSPHIIHTVHT